MAIIERNRTIRPSSRLTTSTSYKIDTSKVSVDDTLVVCVDHESKIFSQKYYFDGADVAGRDSIHFRVEVHNDCPISWVGITPRLVPPPIIMKLEPEWFVMGYYVYVVVMHYNNQRYFYVGMTGDRKYPTARSPFYRMSGHFTLGKSTQNQIIKGIEKHFGVAQVDDRVLCNTKFTYYAWKLNDFIKGDETNHVKKRIFGEQVESCLIEKIKDSFPNSILFNTARSAKEFSKAEKVADQILDDLKHKMNG